MKNFADLKAVIASGKRDELHASFGTHFSKGADPEELSAIANRMLKRCELWKKHWNTILEGIDPDLQKIRSEKLDATAEKFVGYSDDQLQALVDAIKAKHGKKEAA